MTSSHSEGPYTAVEPPRPTAPTPAAPAPSDGASDAPRGSSSSSSSSAHAASAAGVPEAEGAPAAHENQSITAPMGWAATMGYNTTFTFTHADLAMVKDVLIAGVRFEVYETMHESVVVAPDPVEGDECEDAASALGKKGKDKKAKGKDKKKGKGGDEPPLPRKDLPAVITCVGSAVLKLPQFLEGADSVEETMVLLDEDGGEVFTTLPAEPAADEEDADETRSPDEEPTKPPAPITVATKLAVAITLPRVTARAIEDAAEAEEQEAGGRGEASAGGDGAADGGDGQGGIDAGNGGGVAADTGA